MKKYRKKPLIIEAEKFYPCEMPACVIREIVHVIGCPQEEFYIQTLEGKMQVKNGDWIIRDIKGEYYPCKDDIFRATYDEVEE